MVDTIKLAIPFDRRPEWVDGRSLAYTAKGLLKTTMNPSSAYKKAGIYQPRLTYIERWIKGGEKIRELHIELSLPKLYYGNNFDELSDNLFQSIAAKISETLSSTYNVWVAAAVIEQAEVRRIDYSKNILFNNRTPISTIITTMNTAVISKRYDIQNTNFKNGGSIYHIHANNMDIAMYDKIADLQQSRISEKRSYEISNYSQLYLLDVFAKQKAVTVARFEVRLNGTRKICRELKAVGVDEGLRFSELFSTDISREILLRNWSNILVSIPELETAAHSAEQILVSLKQANPMMKFAEATGLTVLKLLRQDTKDERAVRNIIEGLFNVDQYRRLKQKDRNFPIRNRLEALQHITNVITVMTPVKLDELTK